MRALKLGSLQYEILREVCSSGKRVFRANEVMPGRRPRARVYECLRSLERRGLLRRVEQGAAVYEIADGACELLELARVSWRGLGVRPPRRLGRIQCAVLEWLRERGTAVFAPQDVVKSLARRLGVGRMTVYISIWSMVKRGLLRRASYGVYVLAADLEDALRMCAAEEPDSPLHQQRT